MAYTAESFKTQELCDKAFNDSWEIYIYIPDQFKTIYTSTFLFVCSDDDDEDMRRFIPDRHLEIICN